MISVKFLFSTTAVLLLSGMSAISVQAQSDPTPEPLPASSQSPTLTNPAMPSVTTPKVPGTDSVMPGMPSVTTPKVPGTDSVMPGMPSMKMPKVPGTVPGMTTTPSPMTVPKVPGTDSIMPTTPTPKVPGTNTVVPKPEATTHPPNAADKIMATHVVLDLTKRRVTAYKDKEVIASYPVAVGKKGWETPKGNFKVIQMIKNPVWQNPWNGKVAAPGPNSPLGERWIGFWTDGKNTIGFHGTPTIKSIGNAASHGCVRMFNKDVKSLYEVISKGTPVTVK